MSGQQRKVGLWLIGAGGSVASTVALGVAALRNGLTGQTGLVSELPPFAGLALCDPARFELGGHEVRSATMAEGIASLHARSNLFDAELIKQCTPILQQFQENVQPGTLYGASVAIREMVRNGAIPSERTPARIIERLAADITGFKQRHRLDHVVVVYVASSEPPLKRAAMYGDVKRLRSALSRDGEVFAPSSLYALAAVQAHCPFINFTPCAGICVPAIQRLATDEGINFMGNDGKTGETLIKSVLAPMFATRNLEVLSWVGENVLGNRDGETLADPRVRSSKILSKDKVIGRILDYQPHTHVGIDYVPSLDDWKVAWNFIHFRGFLDTRMSMQITWQGSDSALAAPLVLDLVRFAVLEQQHGVPGPMKHLACFFKDPMGATVYDHASQWRQLVEHVGQLCKAS